MTAKYKLRITGECKQNMKLCKRRGLPMFGRYATKSLFLCY